MYQLADLRFLMQRLRDPEHGCPWDLQQDFRSITAYTLEEVYEVVDAIDQSDFISLKDELGDLLFQIIFYAQLAEENDDFTLADIIDGLCEKLIRRHPHIFVDGELYATAQTPTPIETVKQNWETIKSSERVEKKQNGLFADIPLALPAMTRALKYQKRAASIGWDWQEITPILAKLEEETDEFREALKAKIASFDGDANDLGDDVEAELGDMLFTCVNLARHAGINPELALRRANQKFARRMLKVVAKQADQHSTNDSTDRSTDGQSTEPNSETSDESIRQMEALWDQIKQEEQAYRSQHDRNKDDK